VAIAVAELESIADAPGPANRPTAAEVGMVSSAEPAWLFNNFALAGSYSRKRNQQQALKMTAERKGKIIG
jgi:hypothetical protein